MKTTVFIEIDILGTQILSFEKQSKHERLCEKRIKMVFEQLVKFLNPENMHISLNLLTNHHEIHFVGNTLTDNAQMISQIFANLSDDCTLCITDPSLEPFFQATTHNPLIFQRLPSILKKVNVEFNFTLTMCIDYHTLLTDLAEYEEQISAMVVNQHELTIKVKLQARQSYSAMQDLITKKIGIYCRPSQPSTRFRA